MRVFIFATALAALAGCGGGVTTVETVDLREDRAVLFARGDSLPAIRAQARSACAVHGREAVLVNRGCLDIYCFESKPVFACRDRQ